MLGTVAGVKILEVVDHGDALGFSRPEEVFLDRVRTAQ